MRKYIVAFGRYNINIYTIYILVLFIISVILSSIQILSCRSLMGDEAALALSIQSRGFYNLLFPLEGGQVAPILFLYCTKFFTSIFSLNEYSLRVLPLLSYWFSIYLFYKISIYLFNKRLLVIISLTLLVFNSLFLYYSSEFKQYSTDVLVILVLYFYLFRIINTKKTSFYQLVIIGCISIFFSNVAPIILASIGVFLIIQHNYKINKVLFLTFLSWGATFFIYYILFIYGHPAKNYMISYWSEHNSFMPLDPTSKKFYIFFYDKYKIVFRSLLTMSKLLMFPLFLLSIIGLVNLAYSRKLKFIVLFYLPVGIHLILSGFHLYPFDTRLILYLLPLLIFQITYGIEFVFFFTKNIGLFPIKGKYIYCGIPIIWVGLLFKIHLNEFPIIKEDLKSHFEYVLSNSDTEDQIILYYGVSNVFEFYSKSQYLNFSQTIYQCGHECKTPEGLSQIICNNEMSSWMIFPSQYDEQKSEIISYLNSYGVVVDSKYSYGNVDTINFKKCTL